MMNPITLTNDIITLMVAVHHVLLLIYHGYHSSSCFTKSEKSSYIQRLSIVLIIINLFSVTNFTLTTWDWYPYNWSCDWIMTSGTIIYLSAKVILYILISERLFFIFSDSEISFKSCYIWLSRLSFFMYWTILSSLMILLGGGERGIRNCELRMPVTLLSAVTLGDIIISTTISTIFARRLLMLNLKLSRHNKPSLQLYSTKSERSMTKSAHSGTSGITPGTVATMTMETPRCSVVEIHSNGNTPNGGSNLNTPRTSFAFGENEVQVPDISGLTDVTVSNSRATSPRMIVNEVMDAMYDIDIQDVTWKIIMKSTLLSIIALITTPLSIVLLVFFGPFLSILIPILL